jgi:hypothetical protein
MKQYAVSFLIQSDINCDSDEAATAQIAAAIGHHLRTAKVQVLGPVHVEIPHLRTDAFGPRPGGVGKVRVPKGGE